jgi:hypothetical protein
MYNHYGGGGNASKSYSFSLCCALHLLDAEPEAELKAQDF